MTMKGCTTHHFVLLATIKIFYDKRPENSGIMLSFLEERDMQNTLDNKIVHCIVDGVREDTDVINRGGLTLRWLQKAELEAMFISVRDHSAIRN